MNKVKQGQTKWKVVVYEPGKIEGYDNEYVACVYRCFVTKVDNGAVYYTCGNNQHYICSKTFWNNKLEGTFRKAIRKVRCEIDLITENN